MRLYILENEGGTALYTRLSCEGVANLGQFRAFLDSKSIIPWPFQFYDAEEKRRIDTELEQISDLVCFAHKVTVIRSDDRQAMETKSKRVDEEPMALLEPINVKVFPNAGCAYTANDKHVIITTCGVVHVQAAWSLRGSICGIVTYVANGSLDLQLDCSE